MVKTDKIVIAGGGLAGTLLAVRLLMKQKQVSLFDAPAPEAASRVAAGLFNVITGRFGAKSWMADTLLPDFEKFTAIPAFASLNQHVHRQEIYRPFLDAGEYNKWLGRTADPDYAKWVRLEPNPLLPDRIVNPLGGIMITACGWVDIPAWLAGLRAWCLQQQGFRLFEADLLYETIDPHTRQIATEGGPIGYDALVFCEGYKAAANPFFPELPLIPNKGEILVLESAALQLPFVLSRGVYVIPTGDNRYVAGSTYENRFETLTPSPAARQQIEERLAQVIRQPWQVIAHRAGIRPTTPDRKPILGTHPALDSVHIFTGFGTKGMLLAPHFSEVMAQYLLDPNYLLPTAVALRRFTDRKSGV